MLKNLRTRRAMTKYTILARYPVANISGVPDSVIEDSVQMHVVRLQRILTVLDHRPRQVTGLLYRGSIGARAVVRAESDEKLAELLTVVNLGMEGCTVERVIAGVPASPLFEFAVPHAA